MVNSGCVKEDGTVMESQKFPCPTQAVERYLKLVTEASSAVRFPETDTYTRATLKSRKVRPKFDTKAQYATKKEICRRVGRAWGNSICNYLLAVNPDIKKIVERGLVDEVQFNVQKTQAKTLTKMPHVGLPTVEMEGRPLVESSSVKMLGIDIHNHMSWHDHVVTIAIIKTASEKLGILFRCKNSYTGATTIAL
nr:unnamed protein product [Callosobruchus analis]